MNSKTTDSASNATRHEAWCILEHVPGEAEKEGTVYHRSAEVETPLGTFMLSSTSGSRDGEDESVHIVSVHDGGGTEWVPDEARRAASDFASAMFNLVDTAYGTPKRPFWLTGPCPAWCVFTDSHSDGDDPDDRWHGGEIHRVTMSLLPSERIVAGTVPGDEHVEPEFASVWLRQHAEAKEPNVRIGKSEGPEELAFTIAEARQLVETLQRVIAEAEQASA